MEISKLIKKKVIIIDDSDSVRTQLKDWIKNDSIEVFEKSDGNSGFEKIKELDKDLSLIIVDVNMPVLDGISMLKMLKENKLASSVPKIILTTEMPKEIFKEVKSKTENVKAWIVKPIEMRRLKNIILKILPDWPL